MDGPNHMGDDWFGYLLRDLIAYDDPLTSALSHENAAMLDSNVQHAQASCDLSSPWPGVSGGMAHAAHVAAPYHQTDSAAPAPLAQEHVTTFTGETVSPSTTSISHGSVDKPYNLEKTCSISRREGSDDMSFRCLVSECHRSYGRWPDFLRHYNGAHAVKKKAFWCPKDGCARNRVGGNNPFPRKDKLKDHLRQAHGTRRSS
ncbi:hypothetical protein B5807_01620 [Epicoccum nigrum]|uniref:C2H2-type domain-containing protein n=1 Tax=Epicoccum nigrum TaxID=105696 RepID=A0A1Y2MC64_EPING|nr:hypothetical protein B5807_01620 [Epicoccum nigrum]